MMKEGVWRSVAAVLAVVAHPDDAESWCAGALARFADAAAEVVLVVCTSGEAGVPGRDRQGAAALREQEQRDAAATLGVAEVVFLRHPDGALDDSPLLRLQLATLIRRYRPEILVTHDPEHPLPRYFCHRDHRVAGRAALDAAYPLARDAVHDLDGLPPHAVRTAWLFASAQPTLWVDITSALDRKIAARLAHASQTTDPEALAASWRDRFAAIGAEAGLPFAEAFATADAPDL